MARLRYDKAPSLNAETGLKLVSIKFIGETNFAFSYSSYDVIAKKWLGYGYIYPFIELAFGILLLSILPNGR